MVGVTAAIPSNCASKLVESQNCALKVHQLAAQVKTSAKTRVCRRATLKNATLAAVEAVPSENSV